MEIRGDMEMVGEEGMEGVYLGNNFMSKGVKLPILLINLKVYGQAIDNPIKFANIAWRVAYDTGVTIAVAPPHLMLNKVSKIVTTFGQSVDPFEPGAHTGSILAPDLEQYGAVGTLINHSEKRLKPEEVKVCVEQCRKFGLISVVCVQDVNEAKSYATFEPDAIAIEPPELIGKTSVIEADPEIVRRSVNVVKAVSSNIAVLCGAGIKTKEDIAKSLELGAQGVLVASGVVKADNVEESMRELASGFLKVEKS